MVSLLTDLSVVQSGIVDLLQLNMNSTAFS